VTPTTEFRTTCLDHELESASGCGTTLECNCKQKIQLSNLDPGLALGRAYLFFLLIFQWVVIFFSSTVPSGDMMDFQHTPIYRYGWQARIMFAKGFVAAGG
jgi:hypothetical protein